MVRSSAPDAQFWGPGLLIFCTHRLAGSHHVDDYTKCRALPTLEADDYLGLWKEKWPSCASGESVRRMVTSLREVTEDDLMGRVGTR